MINLSQLTPTNLRVILCIALALTVIAASIIFYFANTSLRQVATAVSHKVADADASRNNLENLKKIEKFLSEQKTTIERVNSIVADSQSYQYQDQIIIDLNTYASQAGIAISSINFGGASTSGAPASGQVATDTPTASPAAGSVKSTSVSVTVENPVDYNSLLRFVKSIEQNLTKMQISKISMSKGSEGNDVSTDTLNIEVYIR